MEFTRRKILIGITAFFAVISLPSFLEHYFYLVSGGLFEAVSENRWDFVLLNIAIFLAFLIPLNYRRKADWKSYGVYTAFIVSLFVEMYGIPLTVYISSAAFSSTGAAPEYLVTFSLLGQSLGMNLWMLVGLGITVLGMAIVGAGWYTIYRNREDLVTSGIYGYSRHPQYLGIILISIGWFIGWPTLLTTAILPILVYFYYKLAIKEEKEVAEEVGKDRYSAYRENTPFMI